MALRARIIPAHRQHVRILCLVPRAYAPLVVTKVMLHFLLNVVIVDNMACSDAHIRRALAEKISQSTYRQVALEMDTDYGYLHGVVNGNRPIPKYMAAFVGYELVPTVRRWRKKEAAK